MQTTQSTQITPKIYVACLAAYNNGILHGQWMIFPRKSGHYEELVLG
jgi:hypothetical protein